MLGKIAKELTGKRKVVLVHGNADMDAMGSAYAISKAFPDADIFAPNGIDRITKVVVDKLDVKFLENCDISTYEQVVVVDTSSPEQLEMDQTVPDDAVVIDHLADGGQRVDGRAVAQTFEVTEITRHLWLRPSRPPV